MSAYVHVGSFQNNSSTGSVSVTGVGFQPKGLYIWSENTALTPPELQDYPYWSYGWSDGTTHLGLSSISFDGQATSDMNRDGSTTHLIVAWDTNNTLQTAGQLTSFDSDGFTVNFTSVFGGQPRYWNYIAFGGTEVSVKAGVATANTSTGNQAITGIGFQPSGLLLIPVWNSSLSVDRLTIPAMGWTDGTRQGASYVVSRDGVNPSQTFRYQRTSSCMAAGTDTTGAVEFEASIVSLDSDGFTVNLTTASAPAYQIFYLAIAGLSVYAGSLTQPTSTGTQAISDPGYRPGAVLFQSVGQTAQTTVQSEHRFSFGGCSCSTNRGTAQHDANGVSPTVTGRYYSQTRALVTMTAAATGTSSTVTSAAAVSGFEADGFNLNWTTVDSTQREWLYLTFSGIDPVCLEDTCTGGGRITVVADPTAGTDTFSGRNVKSRAWLALGFGNTTTESTGYFAPDSWNHPTTFFGGRKRGILKQIGRITRQLSDKFSSYKMGSCAVDVDDTSRFFSQAENGDVLFGAQSGELWQNREGRVYLASPDTIAAAGTPHTAFRGIWKTHESEGLSRSLSLIDILGSEFSDFNLEEQHPRRKVKDIFTNAAGVSLEASTTDRDALAAIKTANALYESNKGKPLPIAYGRLSDKSLTAEVVPPVQVSLSTVVANLQASVTGGTTDADWGDIIGHADAIVLEGMGTVPSTYDSLAQVIGYADLDYLLRQETGGGVVITDTGKGKIAPRYVGYYTCADSVVRHAWVIADSPINHVEGRYLDGIAFSPEEPDYHDPESSDWATVSGTSNSYVVISGQTVTMLFMDQGERANQILSGTAALTLNICGREDVGNSLGNTIVAAPRVIFHLLNQSIFLNYLTGTWAAPASSSDGVPWINSVSFDECESIEIERVGGEGYELAIYLDEPLSLRDLLARLQMNTDLRFGQNKYGQVIARHLDDQVDLTTLETITATHDLIAPTKYSRKLDELENAVDYDWDFRPADGTFEEPDHAFSNPVAITANRDRVAKLDRRELFYVLDQATAEDVAARGLSNGSGYVPRFGTFTCNLNVLTRVELGDVVLVTDPDDQGANGQEDRPYWVLGIDTFVGSLEEPPAVQLFCQDVTRFFQAIGVWGPGTLGNWVGEDQDDRRTYFFFANDTGFFNDGAPAKEWR